MALLGRAGECAALREFLTAAHGDPGGTLVVAGAPGAGKTTLVDHVVAAGALRVAGFEAEAGFAYAALHRLLIPVLGAAPHLPAGHRDTLRVACGLADGPPAGPDRVVAAASSLLAAAGPILCVVDDTQWIDVASRTAIVGCAGTPGLGLILVTREPGPLTDALSRPRPSASLARPSAPVWPVPPEPVAPLVPVVRVVRVVPVVPVVPVPRAPAGLPCFPCSKSAGSAWTTGSACCGRWSPGRSTIRWPPGWWRRPAGTRSPSPVSAAS
ncbi:AAA family ATPase [Actinoplanes sp. CA-252034]|uniref:AAA family ATPase n=1 Tax=Actinoplanes sp. CA-252034 TaxID=3239906 RepID=UPI003D98D05C